MGEALRIELGSRIDVIEGHARSARPGEIAGELEVVRRIAAAHGLAAAVTVVHALDAALARGERGPMLREGLSILRDAVRCDDNHSAAIATYSAACSVRLGA
jgi:hypothetical protein